MTFRIADLALAAAIAIPALLIASQAAAHAHLVASTPAADAAVAAPKVLHLKFNEKLEPKFSGCDLVTAAGVAVPVTATTVGDAIDATPKTALKPGAYKLNWHVLSDDGHKSQGALSFTVK